MTASTQLKQAFLNEPDIKPILQGGGCVEVHEITVVIKGLSGTQMRELVSEPTFSILKERIRKFSGGILHLLLVDNGSTEFRTNLYPVACLTKMTTIEVKPPSILTQMQSLLDIEEMSCIMDMETSMILGTSASLSKVFQLEQLESFGQDSKKGWEKSIYEKFLGDLDRVQIGEPLGTPQLPYEYQAISLADILKGERNGLSVENAISQARRLDMGVVYTKHILGSRLVRVATVHHCRFIT